MSPREIREAARLSRMKVAVATGKSINTIVFYEAGGRVAESTRAALDPFYAKLASELGERMGNE